MRSRLSGLGARLLGRPPVVYRARGRPDAVALTFDDGPSQWTAGIAEALEANDCRGTFFIRGAAVAERPEALVVLVQAGHELGNHLWSHSDPAGQSKAELRDELERTAAAIRDVVGFAPRIARPPYCGAPRAVARAAAGGGADAVVLRNVDPADWKAESADEVFDEVISKIGPGDIVCLHDGVVPGTSGNTTREATTSAVERLGPALLDRGLRPVTVSELLG
jgi:peptidoglycan-N-acetylglucosamine deacetylase